MFFYSFLIIIASVVVIDGNPDFDNGETYIAYLQRTSDALYDALD